MITPAVIALATVASAASVLTEDPNPDELKIQIEGALPIAGLFVLVLSGALFLLWLSMRKQFTKIDPSLPAGRDDQEQAFDRRLTTEAVEAGDDAADDSADR